MIDVTYLEPTGFVKQGYQTANEIIEALQDLKEKTIFINHLPVEISSLSTDLIETADHILVQDKLIGA
jgi:hypothetical protein